MKNLFTTSMRTAIIPVLFALIPARISAMVIYVNDDAAGLNNGTNWTNAFTSLTDALSAASSGDAIWVASGVYKPVIPVDLNASGGLDTREAIFTIPGSVALYGGFAGSEISVMERDWETNQTILSGDIDNNDLNADGNFIAEVPGDIVGNNSYHIIYTENAGSDTRVDGFIITAGRADIAVPMDVTDPNLDGGGWFNKLGGPSFGGSPVIANTAFHGNYALSEGGAFFTTPGPVDAEMVSLIENCLFSGNKAGNSGGAIYLGSFSAGNYQPIITGCRFTLNEAYRRGGAIYLAGDHAKIDSTVFNNNQVTAISDDMSTLPGSGGGVNLVASNAVFNACIFEGNIATGNPTGAFEGGGGGAVYASSNDPQTLTLGASEPVFRNCGFYENTASGNTAAWGGAVVHLNDGGILRPKYVNCVFTDNQAQNFGGAIASFTRVISAPDGFIPSLESVFTNCTFAENHAGQRGGALYNDGYLFMGSEVLTSHIENCILWHNTAGVEGPEIVNSGNNQVSYSLIEGSGGSGGGWDTDLGADGGNNSDTDPDFVDDTNPVGPDNLPATDDDGLRLGISSPAVNAGNNSATGLTGITADYTGDSRILGGQVDMGAYERSGIVVPDLDIFWLDEWPDINPPCLSCPQNWSFILTERFFLTTKYVWNGEAQFIKGQDYAVITGEIKSKTFPNNVFKVYLKLVQPRNWANWSAGGGIYFTVTPEASKTAYREHYNWTFWQLSDESYLEGTGNITGRLSVKPGPLNRKTGFQMGKGANAWDSDLGIGGHFAFNGNLNYRGKNVRFSGLGSMNVDAIPCKGECLPLISPEFTVSDENLKNAGTYSLEENPSGLKVFPVPARDYITLDASALEPGIYTVKITDVSGSEKFSTLLNTREGNRIIPLTEFQPGIYLLKLDSEYSEPVYKKLIIDK